MMLQQIAFAFIFAQCVSAETFKNLPAIHQLTGPVELGEGPTWDVQTNLLYFVDLKSGKIFSYDSENGKTFYVQFPGTVSAIIPNRNVATEFFATVNRSLVVFNWDGKYGVEKSRVLATVSKDFPTSRFNDAKADKRGRLWAGTMGHEIGTRVNPHEAFLYRFEKGNFNHPKAVLSNVTISNGLVWSTDNTKFYYIDTPTYVVKEFNFDNDSGDISNPRIVFNFRETIGTLASPDGMTIDVDGNLWVALYGAGSIVKINPKTRKLLQRIALPAQHITSVAWGGKKLDILYVTTSRVLLDRNGRISHPAAGSLFAITGLGTRGLPMYKADIL